MANEKTTIYSIPEAAEILHLKEVTIRRRIYAGEIPFHRFGRRIFFTQKDIDDYIESCAIPARTAKYKAGNKAGNGEAV